jgi:TatD DNase family protein
VIDTHCHLDAPEFGADTAAVLQRARTAGVQAQIIPAVAKSNWQAIATLCAQQPDCYAAYGLHPMYLAQHAEPHLADLRAWLGTHPAVAVGEAGLDYFVPGLDQAQQQHYFEAQLRIARDFDLPVILHARRAYDQVHASLRRLGIKRGVVHSFSGSVEQAQALFRLGMCVGIGGPVTYPRAARLRALVASMPIEHLLLETDAPDQPLFSRQGMRNEPAQVCSVAETVAALRGLTLAQISIATNDNVARVFSIDITHIGVCP